MNRIVKNDIENLIIDISNIDELRNKTVLITGATGLIAKYLTYFFLGLNHSKNTNIKVLALVRNINKAKKSFADFIEDDNLILLNQDVCETIQYEGNIDYIFHAAGSASAYAIRTNPTGIIRANTIGTMNVLELAKEKKVKKIIFPSTREIYGKVENTNLITENDMGVLDPLDSRNCYPESKRISEAMFKSYQNQYGINFNILRIAHTYGPTMELFNDGRVMADFIKSVVSNENIILNSDGTAIRSFCYVTDTIKGILQVLISGNPGEAYNLANEREPYMIRTIAQMLVDFYPEKKIKLVFSNQSDDVKKGYVNYKIVQLDTTKIESLGWEPDVTLSDGLKRTVQYFEEEQKLTKRV